MSEALVTQKHIILMKSGLAHFVEKRTADIISAGIVSQSAHRFIKITELDQLINSAEIEGIYTPEKYEEFQRVKAGETLCAYYRWHKKREVCECAAEMRKSAHLKMQQMRRDEENRPLTPEERENARRIIAGFRADAAKIATNKKI